MGLTGFVIIHVFIALFSPAQGEQNQTVNTKFTRPLNEMPMFNPDIRHNLFRSCSIVILKGSEGGRELCESFYNVYSCNAALLSSMTTRGERETAAATAIAAVQFVSKSNPLLDSFVLCAKLN